MSTTINGTTGINRISNGASIGCSSVITAQGGTEGGEIILSKPQSGTNITNDIILDVQGDSVRFYEAGGTFRGASLPIPQCAIGASSRVFAGVADGSAPVYACRAWVNFNGTGTVAIRASGNVSSITDNGTGDYTVNFTTAMQDINYSKNISLSSNGINTSLWAAMSDCSNTGGRVHPTTTQSRFTTMQSGVGPVDPEYVYFAAFR